MDPNQNWTLRELADAYAAETAGTPDAFDASFLEAFGDIADMSLAAYNTMASHVKTTVLQTCVPAGHRMKFICMTDMLTKRYNRRLRLQLRGTRVFDFDKTFTELASATVAVVAALAADLKNTSTTSRTKWPALDALLADENSFGVRLTDAQLMPLCVLARLLGVATLSEDAARAAFADGRLCVVAGPRHTIVLQRAEDVGAVEFGADDDLEFLPADTPLPRYVVVARVSTADDVFRPSRLFVVAVAPRPHDELPASMRAKIIAEGIDPQCDACTLYELHDWNDCNRLIAYFRCLGYIAVTTGRGDE